MSRCLTAVSIAVLTLALGCAMPTVTDENVHKFDDPVVRADTLVAYAMTDIYDLLARSSVLPRGGTWPADSVRAFLDSILVDTLAGLRADSFPLQESYEYHRQYRQRYHEFLIRKFATVAVTNRVDIDSADVVAFYEENPQLFQEDEQVFVYHIFMASLGLLNGPDSLLYRSLPGEKVDSAVAEYAREVKEMLDAGEVFQEVAKKMSHDRDKRNADGLLGWVSRGRYEAPFDSIAFSLDVGQYSEPFKTSNGWHIIYVTDHREAGTRPLTDSLFVQVEGYLTMQKANELARPLIDSLDNEINLEINQAVLDSGANVHLLDKTMWAAVLNDRDTIEVNDLRNAEEGYRRQFGVDNTTPEQKRQMLHDVARRFILIQAARATGIDTLPEVRERREALWHKYAKIVVLQDASDPGWAPPDSIIEQYFESHRREFDDHRPVRVQQIVAEDSSLAEFVRDQAISGTDFLELAEQYYASDEPGIRRELADLGWIGRNDVSPEFFNAAITTPDRGVSPPVKSQYGWHVIKVLERKKPANLGMVRNRVVPILKKEHARQVWQDFRDRLFDDYNVQYLGRIFPVQLPPLAERKEDQRP